jgi:hypothetical protein
MVDHPLSLGERYHQYAIQLSKMDIWSWIIPTSIKELPIPIPESDVVLLEFVWANRTSLWQYVGWCRWRQYNIPERFEYSDQEMVAIQIPRLNKFLFTHRYDTANDLSMSLGLPGDVAKWFMDCGPAHMNHSMNKFDPHCYLIVACERQRCMENGLTFTFPFISASGWDLMLGIMHSMVERMRRERIYELSESEREKALAEALKKKRGL